MAAPASTVSRTPIEPASTPANTMPSGDGRRTLLAAPAPSGGRGAAPWLNELLVDPHTYWQDDWLRACALYAASELAPESAAAAALTWQDAADPVLAETARWLRGELARPSPPRVE
jgi:hypothetical protein